jgi:hypothetical protein
VPGRGSTHIRCSCKHPHDAHRTSDGRAAPCSAPGCGCSGFHSDWRCGSCGESYDAHGTLFETARDRAASGKPVESNLGGWSEEKPHLDAVCGGVTRMSSLLSGVERTGLVANLPHTDGVGEDGGGSTGGACAVEVMVPAALSSTAAVFANYDRKADAHVARLKKMKERSEANQFANGAKGHKLGGTPAHIAAAVLGGAQPPPAGSARAAVAAASSACSACSASSSAPGAESSRAGGSALVPRPPPPGAAPPGVGRPAVGGGARRGGAVGKAAMRTLAASAAEARMEAMGMADGATAELAGPTAAARSSERAIGAGRDRQAATAPPPVPPPAPVRKAGAPSSAGGAKAGGAGPRGAAKMAVAAVRRERAAEAAERRHLGMPDS